MAPCVAPSPLPLKTPETEVVIQITAIGGGPGNLRGSISLPLLGAHASDARKNISYGRQKSQKPTVVGISTGFLTFLTLLTGLRHFIPTRDQSRQALLRPVLLESSLAASREGIVHVTDCEVST